MARLLVNDGSVWRGHGWQSGDTTPPGPGEITDGAQINPDGSNTGFVALGLTEGDLTPASSFTTTADGQLIEGLSVTGRIRISHHDVTIRGCHIAAPAGSYTVQCDAGISGLLVEFCRLHSDLTTGSANDIVQGTSNVPAGLPYSTVRRNHATHGADLGKASSGWIYEANLWIPTVQWPGAHNDGVQITKCDDTLHDPAAIVRFNRFVMGNLDGSTYMGNACVWLRGTNGDIKGVVIEGNWCQASEVTEAIKLRGDLDPTVIDDITITGNKIVQGWPPAAPGPENAIVTTDATNVTRSGNRFVDVNGNDLGSADP